jgi:hypothetical protein
LKNRYSNESHQHFIDILQKALNLLKASVASGKATSKESDITESSGNAAAGDRLANRFAGLEVEDPEEYDLTVTEIATREPRAAKKGSASASASAYDLELEDEWEISLAIFCFFEDAHRLHEYLVSILRFDEHTHWTYSTEDQASPTLPSKELVEGLYDTSGLLRSMEIDVEPLILVAFV